MTAKKASKRRQKDAQDNRAAGVTSQQRRPALHPSNGLLVSDMAAPKGNQFWKERSKHGRDLIFADPATLWKACCEYFEWVEANPLYEDRLFAYQGEVTHEPAAKMRAMTLDGLCIFLDISFQTWLNYKKRNDFLDIIGRVESIVCVQKFTGAAAGLLNPNVIARDLGLADKSEMKADDKSMAIDWEMSVESTREFRAALKAFGREVDACESGCD